MRKIKMENLVFFFFSNHKWFGSFSYIIVVVDNNIIILQSFKYVKKNLKNMYLKLQISSITWMLALVNRAPAPTTSPRD